MAFPIILIDSATGSDTAASGAGPATALTGSAASTSADGLTVTLDGSPSLAGVATDGSHAIFLSDSTTGARNFAKITAKDDTAKTVTVLSAFGTSLTGKSWAIGGKRASLGSTTSRKLAENNSGAGDAMPGWTIELQSGHSETLSATINFRRAGDTTDGYITIRGAAGYATLPLLTFSNNGDAIAAPSPGNGGRILFQDFELRNTNATKTASSAFNLTGPSGGIVRRIRVAHATNKFWRGLSFNNPSGFTLEECEFGYCAGVGVIFTLALAATIQANFIHDCTSDGVSRTGSSGGGSALVTGNVLARNGGYAYNDTRTGTGGQLGERFFGNTIHGNTSGGLRFTGDGSTVITPLSFLRVENNAITGNGGYGINFTGSPTQAILDIHTAILRNNCFGSGATANTSGTCSLASAVADPSNLAVDPGYVNAAANNFTPTNAALQTAYGYRS